MGAGGNDRNLCIMDVALQTTFKVSDLEGESLHLSYATIYSYLSL